ncbi:MAG: hypothetical protein Q9227_009219 [Pyrenula ochraceoflavens]
MHPFLLYALLPFASVLGATPGRPTFKRLKARNETGTACAVVSSSASAALAANPSGISQNFPNADSPNARKFYADRLTLSATPIVDAVIAKECLDSVPFHENDASALLDSIAPYIEWQSTISYLRDPPSGYTLPAYDIEAQFAAIRSKVSSRSYPGEIAFENDLFDFFQGAHDGHFRFLPDGISTAIRWNRNAAVISISLNGTDIPQIYELNDVMSLANGGPVPSVVTAINGQDAVTFIENNSLLSAQQDYDALWNIQFYSKQFAATSPSWMGYIANSGRYGYIFPGFNTTLAFQNGTTRSYTTTSSVIGDFTGVIDGDTFYQTFCNPNPTGTSTGDAPNATSPTTSSSSAPSGTPSPGVIPVPGYPDPIVAASDHSASGYYLNSDANSDVAVLSLLTFEPESPAEFQATIQTFIADAKAAGKTKVIIDVGANGGGYILLGYDAFRQFFPQIEQDGFTRFRDIDTVNIVANQFAEYIPANFTPQTASSFSPDIINAYESFENYRYDYNLTDGHFTSVPDKFGPVEFNGDNFTNIIRWDLQDDPLTTVNSTYGIGIEITGYNTRANFTQPFEPENIILYYDAYCASTCTLFSEFMRLQAGIKSVVIGGRPSYNPMQSYGGVKGANNFAYSDINFYAQLAYNSGTPEEQAGNLSSLLEYNLLAVNRSTDTSINVRDNILRPNLDDGTPAQFIYEAADCRLFYEPAMVTDVTAQWEKVANVVWGDTPCAVGDVNQKRKKAREAKPEIEGRKEAVRRSSLGRAAGVHAAELRRRQAMGDFDVPSKDAMLWTARNGRKIPQ